MSAQLQFFDMAVSVTPPSGHLEPLPITLGPNWQSNDIRLLFLSGSGASGQGAIEMAMNPDPPTGFTAAYAPSVTRETRGVYYRRLQAGDSDASVYWAKPSSWQYFMFATLTVRGASPTGGLTAGPIGVTYSTGDSTGTTATAGSVAVPGNGSMVFFVGNVPAPEKATWPNWAVSMGVPSGWTNLVATDKSGDTFYEYGTDSSLVVVGKSFTGSGSTGAVAFPTAHGSPAFTGLYVFLSPAADVSAAIGAA